MAHRIPPLLLVALLVPGCVVDGDPSSPTFTEDTTIRDPTDFSYLQKERGDRRPHVHDYWVGQQTIQVFSGSFQVDQSRGVFEVKLEDGTTIIPGTRWINVSAKWTSQGLPGNTLAVIASRPDHQRVSKDLAPDGTPAVINTTDEFSDPPHAQITRWKFEIWRSGLQSLGASAQGTITVTIARTPGNLSLAPPHPDHWKTNTTLTLFDKAGPLFILGPRAVSNVVRPNQYPPVEVVPKAPSVIPPFTDEVQIELWFNSSTPPALHWAPLLSFHGADRSGWEKERMRPSAPSPGRLSWTIQVEPRMWDSPYVNDTYWQFYIEWRGDPQTEARYMDGNYHLRLEIRREIDSEASRL